MNLQFEFNGKDSPLNDYDKLLIAFRRWWLRKTPDENGNGDHSDQALQEAVRKAGFTQGEELSNTFIVVAAHETFNFVSRRNDSGSPWPTVLRPEEAVTAAGVPEEKLNIAFFCIFVFVHEILDFVSSKKVNEMESPCPTVDDSDEAIADAGILQTDFDSAIAIGNAFAHEIHKFFKETTDYKRLSHKNVDENETPRSRCVPDLSDLASLEAITTTSESDERANRSIAHIFAAIYKTFDFGALLKREEPAYSCKATDCECEDPDRELQNNGRDVTMDAIATLKARLLHGAWHLLQKKGSAPVSFRQNHPLPPKGVEADEKSKMLNESVSSPTPQHVLEKIAPFTQLSDEERRQTNVSNRRQNGSGGGCCQCDNCDNNTEARQRVCGCYACKVADDPHRELPNNGRGVAMNKLQMRTREGAGKLSQNNGSAAVSNSLKRRLSQGAVADVKIKLRNESVSSPTPQQVSWKVAPFTQHFSSTGAWGLLPWENSDGARRKCSNRRQSCSGGGCCRCDNRDINRDSRQRVYGGNACDVAENRGEELSNKGPRFHSDWERPACNCRPRPRPRLSTTCEDPHRELLNNGREVAMDAVDVLQVRLRGCARQLSQGDDSAAVGSSLKQRLAQIRAAIRKQLADQAALAVSHGRPYCCSSRRKDKHRSKKCKFCLSKKEDEDIVTSHNLHDAQGLVTCPILQQYECELCHATGRQAHTIKYCPLNNPDTPHDLILGARLKVMIRNRYGH